MGNGISYKEMIKNKNLFDCVAKKEEKKKEG